MNMQNLYVLFLLFSYQDLTKRVVKVFKFCFPNCNQNRFVVLDVWDVLASIVWKKSNARNRKYVNMSSMAFFKVFRKWDDIDRISFQGRNGGREEFRLQRIKKKVNFRKKSLYLNLFVLNKTRPFWFRN